LTTRPTDPPPARRGLAKLRGAEEPSSPTSQVTPVAAEQEPQAAVSQDLAQDASGGVVTLTKTDPLTRPSAVDQPVLGTTPRRKGPGRAVIAALVALVVAIAVLVPLVLVNPFDSTKKANASATGPGSGSGGTADERLAVVRAARQFTVSFFTYDYRKLPVYFQRIEAASSGAFRKDFVSKESTLKTVVTQLKTVATGQVPDSGAGLFQLNGDNATVLVAANLNASNAVTKNGQQRYRVKIALQRIKGVWLVTNFDEVV
jgi:Mce-associated membrane protein